PAPSERRRHPARGQDRGHLRSRPRRARRSIEVAGHSTVAAPEELLGSLEEEEAVLRAELDMDHLRGLREVDLSFRRSLYFCLHGRRPELYGRLREPYSGHQDLKSLLTEYLTRR
ncbi:hypothetical protein ACWEWX_51735, partial [Streptomyces asiaticus]